MATRLRKGLQILQNDGFVEFTYQTLRHILSKNNVKTRPSKTYLHRLFDKDLEQYSHCERAADIAAADFKNTDDFNSKVYFGVDNSQEKLKRGLKEYEDKGKTDYVTEGLNEIKYQDDIDSNRKKYVALEGDMRDQIFPESSLDFIASTHTLHHIPPSTHKTVIQNFCNWLRPNGCLLLQLSNSRWYTNEIQKILEDEFVHVETELYKNKISTLYERIIYGYFGGPPDTRVGTLLSLCLTHCLLPLEKSGYTGGQYIYIKCVGKY